MLDAVGCPFTETVTIQAIDCSTLNALAIKTDQTYYQINDGTAEINVGGGTTPYTYSWSNGASTSSIANLAPGTYTIELLDALLPKPLLFSQLIAVL